MSYFDESHIRFKITINNLFETNKYECKKLFFGYEIYYYGIDILKCLKYNEKTNIEELNKIRQKDKYTIKELEKQYNISINLNEKFIFINKYGLYHIISNSYQEDSKAFKNFVNYSLFPLLDHQYKEIINFKDKEINKLYVQIKQISNIGPTNEQKILKELNLKMDQLLIENNKILNKVENIESKNIDIYYYIKQFMKYKKC